MLVETETSIYKLERVRTGGFRLTKVAVKSGQSSGVAVGQILEGKEIIITENGIFLGKKKTGSIALPLVD